MNHVIILQQLLMDNKSKEDAYHMEKYMRNQFSFLGIRAPQRKKLVSQFFNETLIKEQGFQPEFVRSLWRLKEREYQYAAMDYLEVSLTKLKKKDITLLEELITTNSWWDTVDMLAQKAVGKIALAYPEVVSETIERWNQCDNLWLQRTSILFQLKYKEKTKEEILYRYIRTHEKNKEFFIQKAIGWALREYSKTNPDSVRNFIAHQPLAKLSIREGSKYI